MFQHLGLISSSPATFPDFIPLIAVATFAALKTSSFAICVTPCLSRVNAFTGFKRSLKYSLHRERISFSSVRMYLQNPWWSTCHSIFCHVNGGWSVKIVCLPKNSSNPTDNQTLPLTFPWISSQPKLPLFAP